MSDKQRISAALRYLGKAKKELEMIKSSDMGVELVELLAFVGDQLSNYQDTIAQEAVLKEGDRSRVVGIGGIFIRAREPAKLAGWYRKHLGIGVTDNVAVFGWRNLRNPSKKGHTIWALFPPDSTYIDTEKQFMINYRVKDLEYVLGELRGEGVKVARKIEVSRHGKFGWAHDPEENRIELWEPPREYEPPEEVNAME